jgi:hypothetical protein
LSGLVAVRSPLERVQPPVSNGFQVVVMILLP